MSTNTPDLTHGCRPLRTHGTLVPESVDPSMLTRPPTDDEMMCHLSDSEPASAFMVALRC